MVFLIFIPMGMAVSLSTLDPPLLISINYVRILNILQHFSKAPPAPFSFCFHVLPSLKASSLSWLDLEGRVCAPSYFGRNLDFVI